MRVKNTMTKVKLWPMILLALLLLNYNNCSSSKMTYDENPQKLSSSSLDPSTICSQSELDIFDKGYHSFLKTTCNNCHVSGPGKGAFAHPDAQIAFNAFTTLGYEKVSSMAVSDSHNYPYTGSHNLERISALKEQWKTFLVEKAKCGATSEQTPVTTIATFTPLFITSKKTIPTITGTPKTVDINGSKTSIVEYNVVKLSFNLDSELSALGEKALPLSGGAKLTLTLTGYSTPSGTTGYIVGMPTLRAGTKSLRIKGLHIVLNGQPVRYAYTFQHVEANVYKGTDLMLSGGSMLVLGPILSDDQLAITIGDLDVIEMSAPPAPATISFALSGATVQQNELGYGVPHYKVPVVISGESATPITVLVAPVGDESQPIVAKGILGDDGKNRFDWDYRFRSPLSLTFLPGESQKYIELIFSDDKRPDPTKTLTLELQDPFGAKLGAKSQMVLTLPNYNPSSAGETPTFAQLMKPGGILEMNCVRCHNSIDKQGGYDMTDYQMMVDKGVIVPGDLTPNNHKMFRRMNPDAPGAGSITPMPLDGFLTQDLTIIVEDWIKAGAQNN